VKIKKINLLSGSVTYGAVTILSRIASIVLIPILTSLLSPEEYGILSVALTLVTFVNFVVTFEVAQGVTLFFTDRNRADRNLYPSTAIRFSLVMYLGLLLFVAVFGEMIFRMIVGGTTGPAVIINGAMLLAANGIFFLIQNQFRLELNSRGYAILTLAYVLLTSFGAVGGALFFNHPAEGVIFGQAGGAAIVDVVGVLMLWKSFRGGFDLGKLREMLKFSLPLVPAGLLLVGGQHVPKLILSIYGSLEDVGIYGLSYQIAGFSALAVLGVQTAITPSILANHKEAETPKMLGRLFERFAIIALILCSSLSIFASELVMIFSASSYRRAADFVPFLAFAIALNCFYIFFPGKIIRGKSTSQLIGSACSFLVAVVTGLLLIRFDGVRGAALSALLSSATFFFIWCHISQKLYRVPVNWLKLIKSLVLAAAVSGAGIFLTPTESMFYSFAIKSVLLLLLVGLIARDYLFEWWHRAVGQH
jgi:O-antigen/teichoic acid export membrane protein